MCCYILLTVYFFYVIMVEMFSKFLTIYICCIHHKLIPWIQSFFQLHHVVCNYATNDPRMWNLTKSHYICLDRRHPVSVCAKDTNTHTLTIRLSFRLDTALAFLSWAPYCHSAGTEIPLCWWWRDDYTVHTHTHTNAETAWVNS